MNREAWLESVRVDHRDPKKRKTARAYHRRRGEELCLDCTVVLERMLNQSRTPRRPIVHGTHRGYVTHRRRGEEACEPCRIAHAVYAQERYWDGR